MKKLLRNLALAGLIGVSGLEARAETYPITTTNDPINLIAGPVTNDCSAEVLRETQYKVNATAGVGGYITGNTNDWFDEGSTNVLIAVPNEGYDFSNWTTNGGYAGNNRTNSFVINMPLNIQAVFSLRSFTYIFKDPLAGVFETNNVPYGSSKTNTFPRYVYQNGDTNSNTRFKAKAINANNVGIQLE